MDRRLGDRRRSERDATVRRTEVNSI